MKKIDLLRELQDIDTELDQVRRDLEQRTSRLGDDSELVPLRQELEAARSRLASLMSETRELDYQIEDRSSKLKKNEKKLYDGSVKNPKELSSMAHEVEIEKAQVSKLEDRALALMDAVESASAAEAAATAALSDAEHAWREAQARLESEHAALAGREAELSARRQQLAAKIDASTLRTYEGIRRTRAGVAVVSVQRAACQGCRISLSSSVIQRARAGAELVPCQNCGRLLYVP